MDNDPIFEPLTFKNLTVKNRIFRSNISGRFDNYDGSGNRARINWECKFAKGGVGGIISSFVPVSIQGRIVPNYATIHTDDHIPFWRELGRAVHEYDCRYLMQLSHSGRQRDIPGIEIPNDISSTSRAEDVHGLHGVAMTIPQIREVVGQFAQGARRAREAGLDGVELHSANGYLFTQFLSSAINDRKDEYGGSLENRARFLREVVQAIRAEVGYDFHLQSKLSTTEFNNAFFPWAPKGNTIKDTIQVAKWLEEDGVDAIHVSTGSSFPHPRNPAGDFPTDVATRTYGVMLASGGRTFTNFLVFKTPPFNRIFRWWWVARSGPRIDGLNLPDARSMKAAVKVPVLCTGRFQTASIIRNAIRNGDCDAVSIARPLVANNDLVQLFAQGLDRPPNPCTYCNKCLFNVIANPLGCYEESRFGSHQEMIDQIMTVFDPAPYPAAIEPQGPEI